ncbi:MAG: hypothetical protein WD750_00495 [Gammaproteobacteria bacterium]
MHLPDRVKITTVFFVLPIVFTSVTLQAQHANDMRDLVQMPLAVDKAVKAGLSARDVEIIARSMRDGHMPPQDFNQTFRDVSYVAAERGPEGVQDIGKYTSDAVGDGLRGQELARSIHSKLQVLGIPAGGRHGQGPPPMAQDYIPDHAIDRIRQRQNASGGGTGRRDDSAGQRNAERDQRNDTPAPHTRNRMEQQSPGGPDYRGAGGAGGAGPGGAGGRPGGRP